MGLQDGYEDYENIVFPTIGQQFPMVICSDNHNAKEYKLKIPNWIRADPTFKGLRQILNEPTGRVYRGDLPPILKRIAEHKTKYINKVTIRKVPGSTLDEVWFDCEILLNPGLIAIIGNKGSGKSALTDAVGLVGQTRNGNSFSFLNTSKFRQPKNNKAQHFRATLSWESGPDVDRILDKDVDATAVETVKYIPQNHLESICNELHGGSDSRFDHELKSVIFSHVGAPGNLDFESLDDLIKYKTTETYTAIELLRSELRKINEQVVAFEEMLLPDYKKSLEALEAEKKKELDALDGAKPATVSKPEMDPAKQAEMAALTEQIGNLRTELANLEDQRDKLLDEQKQVTRRSTVAAKLLSKIDNFKKQHQMFLNDSMSDFGELGISPEQVVQVLINTSSITAVKADADLRVAEIAGALDSSTAGSVESGISSLKATLTSSSNKLDAPNKEYQDFVAALTDWNEKRAAIVGDETTVGTYKNLQARIKALEKIPAELTEAKTRRTEKASEIYYRFQSLVELYKDLYKPVHEFIEKHQLAKQELTLDFEVRIVDTSFDSDFFRFINQQKKGSFCGKEEGTEVLKKLLEKADWDSATGTMAFVDEILHYLTHDHRQPAPPDTKIGAQLKNVDSLVDLYDFLFSFEYLKPKYNLRWAGREIGELSPGERGTVLLLFYLLIDNANIPLIIDQPEENVDNQTVFGVLVPAIKKARDRRQIMLVTHNPNLAVVCDADQVIYSHIDKKCGNRVTYTSGAIEDPSTNRKIIDVLEGTRPAFDNREAKYQETNGV